MDADDVNRLIDEGRATVVRGLRDLAERIEALPAADIDAWLLRLEPTIATVREWAERATRSTAA
jgi:hypothetical protein